MKTKTFKSIKEFNDIANSIPKMAKENTITVEQACQIIDDCALLLKRRLYDQARVNKYGGVLPEILSKFPRTLEEQAMEKIHEDIKNIPGRIEFDPERAAEIAKEVEAIVKDMEQ
jgi:hypothetical protein